MTQAVCLVEIHIVWDAVCKWQVVLGTGIKSLCDGLQSGRWVSQGERARPPHPPQLAVPEFWLSARSTRSVIDSLLQGVGLSK